MIDELKLLSEVESDSEHVSLDQNQNIVLIEIDYSNEYTGNIKVVVRKIRDLNSGRWLRSVVNLPVAGCISPVSVQLLVSALTRARHFAELLDNIYKESNETEDSSS